MMFWSHASAARLPAIGLMLVAAGATVAGQTSQLKKLSLQELASIEVTSVSKRPETA